MTLTLNYVGVEKAGRKRGANLNLNFGNAFLQPDSAAEHTPEGDVLAEDAGGRVALEGDVHGVRDRLQHGHLLRRT